MRAISKPGSCIPLQPPAPTNILSPLPVGWSAKDEGDLESHVLKTAKPSISQSPWMSRPTCQPAGRPSELSQMVDTFGFSDLRSCVTAARVIPINRDFPFSVSPVLTAEHGSAINWITQMQHPYLWAELSTIAPRSQKNKIRLTLPNTYTSQTLPKHSRGRNTPKLILRGHHHPDT